MTVTTTTQRGYWETMPLTVIFHADREIWTMVYEGNWDDLGDEFGGKKVGDVVYFKDDVSSTLYQDSQVISNISMNRKTGGLGEVRIQYTLLYKREIWNLDFSEVSKNIKNWLVREYTTWTNGEPTVDIVCYEELQKIKQWEHQKDIGAFTPWGKFLYDGKNALSGKTLKLAQKMMKGIDNYPVYSPVITRTTTWAISPTVGKIGYKNTPASREGWLGFNGGSPLSYRWLELAKVFLKTAERSNSNGDGTFTLLEQWIGADELDPDLYPS